MRARRISRAAVGFAKAVRRDGDRWFVTTGGGELAIRIVTVLYGLVSERTACRCDKRVARAEELGRIQRGKPRLPLAGAREATREMESLYETARLMRSHPAYCVPADILGGVRAALDGCSRTPRVMPGRFAENAPARPLEWARFPSFEVMGLCSSVAHMKLLLAGATGVVGSHVLRLALADARVDRVVAPTRRALEHHAKLTAPLVDFEQLPEGAAWWQADAVICTLGTTMKSAASREAFRRVDHDYPLAVARLARRHGTPTFALNSALGANASSWIFYNRVKGEVERALGEVGFTSLTHVRPGLIGSSRVEVRTGERAMLTVLGALGPVLPRRWRINPAENIARALFEAAIRAEPGVHVIASDELA